MTNKELKAVLDRLYAEFRRGLITLEEFRHEVNVAISEALSKEEVST